MVDQPSSKTKINPTWKILIIDDDEDDFLIARDMLKDAKGRKFDIRWANTFAAGREELISDHYNAVLVDYDLGPHSGIELIREASERGYAAPLILFTGRGNYEVDVEAMEAGATLYLTKGEVNPLLLERAIRYAIEMKHKEQSIRESEAALRMSEAKERAKVAELNAIMDAVPAIVWITHDPEAKEVTGNPAAHDFLRVPVGKNLSKSAPQDAPRNFKVYQEGRELTPEELPLQITAATGQPIRNFEEEVAFEDGDRAYLLGNVTPLLDDDGKPCGAVGAFINITERKQVEEALRQAHQKAIWMARFPDENPNPVARVAADGVILYCNATSAALPGLNFAVGQPLTGAMMRLMERAMTLEQEVREDVPVLDRYYSFSIMPIREENYANIYGTDITERKRALESLHRQSEALRESEERFRRAIMSAPYPIMIRRNDGRVMMINETWTEITGYTLKDIPTVADWTKRAYGENAVQVQATMRNEDYSQSAKRGWGEFEVTTRSGVKRIWDFSTADLGKDQEGLALVLVMAVDVTERNRTEAALHDYAEKLKRSNQELEQFAFIASHDLQEPLRKIILFGNSLRQHLCNVPDEAAEEYLGRMQNAAGRMQAMVNGLLDLSRVNTRGRELIPIQLKQVVEEVVSDLEPRIQAVSGQVVVEHLPTVKGDEVQLHELFQNLIGNALKFHKPDVPPIVRVTGTLQPTANAPIAEIRVADNGIGFAQEHAERIFQPFQRLHGRSEYEGTGLGLAICKKIVERHNGVIEVQSVPGEGTVFIVRLPTEPTSNIDL